MATLAKRGTTQTNTGTTWASLTNAVDGTAGTNPATYATMTSAVSAAVATIELGTFDFASGIAAGDTLNSVSVSLRHFENNTGRFASVRFQAFDGGTAIGSQTTCTLATAARTDTATVGATLAQLRSSTFKVVVTITGAASTQSRIFSIDQVDVTADYTVAVSAITQDSYRFYADGTETGSSAVAAEDTAYTADVSADVSTLVRVRLQTTNAVATPSTDDWQLQWEPNASGTWTNVSTVSPENTAESITEASLNTDASIGDGVNYQAFGQSFSGNGQLLARAGFYIRKTGSPPGDMTVALYASSGPYTSLSSSPSGSAITTSAPVAASTVGTGNGWIYFTFDNTVTLTTAADYFIILLYSAGSVGNALTASTNNVGGNTHAGVSQKRLANGAWAGGSTIDFPLRLYTVTPGTGVLPFASTNLTDAGATTNRLGAGSGSFVAGEISETGLASNLGWSASNYTELLYPVTLKAADLWNGDVLRFRVLRNGATTVTYTQTPTVNVTSTTHVRVGYVTSGKNAVASDADGNITIAVDAGTATNRVLWVHQASFGETGVTATYNGVAMTLVDRTLKSGSIGWWYLQAPASGTNNLVMNGAAVGDNLIIWLVTSDTLQSGAPYDGYTTPEAASGLHTATVATSSSGMGVWFDCSGNTISGPNRTSRQINNLNGGSGIGNTALQTATGTGGSLAGTWADNGDQWFIVGFNALLAAAGGLSFTVPVDDLVVTGVSPSLSVGTAPPTMLPTRRRVRTGQHVAPGLIIR